MAKAAVRRWLSSLRARPGTIRNKPIQKSNARLRLERLEGREVPSSSMPLSDTIWTEMGPRPITLGESPGRQSATGRFDSVAVDPTNSNLMYAASAVGGIWTSTNGGNTWTPRTDFFSPATPVNSATQIRVVHRSNTATNTVYAVSQSGGGFFYLSNDNGQTFSQIGVTSFTNRRITKFIVQPDPATPNDQTKDLIYAAVQSLDNGTTKAGIYRSKDGGQTWTNIVTAPPNGFPFTPDALAFSDVDVDPFNREVVYASIDSGPNAGVYRTTTAFTSNTPTWNLSLGGAANFSGFLPGRVVTEVSPVLSSVIFAAVASGQNFIALYRSTDTGVNWSPLFTDTFSPTGTVPNFTRAAAGPVSQARTYMNINIDPRSPFNPTQQTIYLSGFGDPDFQVIVSHDSGQTWGHSPLNGFTGDSSLTYARGKNGVGPYIGARDAVLDGSGRLMLATEGGIYRMNDQFTPQVIQWTHLNGTATTSSGGKIGQTLNTVQVPQFGQALSPSTPDQMIINAAPFHSAVKFEDNSVNASWRTVDDLGQNPFHMNAGLADFSILWGQGPVLYDFNQGNTVYRITRPDPLSGIPFMRRSDDAGNTWADTGFPGPLFPGAFTIDQSDSRFLFTGLDDVYLYQSTNGAFDSITNVTGFQLPSIASGGLVTAVAVSRQNKILYAATTPITYAWEDAQLPAWAPRTRLYAMDISGTFGGGTWVELSLPNDVAGNITGTIPPDQINQIVVDPNNQFRIYLTTASGKIYQQRTANPQANLPNVPPNPDPNNGAPPPPDVAAAMTWQQLNATGGGNTLPTTDGQFPNATGVNAIALDPYNATLASDDALYWGTNNGVYKLSNNFTAATNNFKWERVGGTTTATNSLPNVAVRDLDINTTTGIMSVALNGRGVWQIRIRGEISGQVFQDKQGDGAKNGTDNGLSGFVITLKDKASNSIIATTVTDANGNYIFRSVPAAPGGYEVTQLMPTGWVVTTPEVVTFATFGITDAKTANFGDFRLVNASGVKFDDANQNGIKEPTEAGVGGFSVYIDTNNNQTLDVDELFQITDSAGAFSFQNLEPPFRNGVLNPAFEGFVNGLGNIEFTLREVQQPGWAQTVPNPAVNFGAASVVAFSGDTKNGINFGNFRIGSIRGQVFIDNNSNTKLDGSEPGMAGVQVFLDTNNNGTLDWTDGNSNGVWDAGEGEQWLTSDATGAFQFVGLAPGTYKVRQVVPVGFTQTTTNPADAVLTSTNSVTGILFGNVPTPNFRVVNQWFPVGPMPQLQGDTLGSLPVSGRITGVSVDPTNPARYFIAAAGGGVWRTTDAGQTWASLTNNVNGLTPLQSTAFMGAIAIAPSAPNVIYAGTGEATNGPDAYYGRGILKSTDSGASWTLIQGPLFNNIPAFDRRVISKIIVDPSNADRVFVILGGSGVNGFNPNVDPVADNGIWRTLDGGVNWENITSPGQFGSALFPRGTYISDAVINPTNPNVLYVAVGNPGGSTANGIYLTSNALGASPTFNLLIGGSSFVPGTLPGLIKLAIAPSQPSTLYASLAQGADPANGNTNFLGVYKTTDSGINWQRLVNAPDFMGTTGAYNNSIIVSPTNPNIVYAGGVSPGTNFPTNGTVNVVTVSNDGGNTWRSVVGGSGAAFGPHSFVHALTFDSSGRLLVGTDGGLFRLNNASIAPPFGGTIPQWVSLNGATGSLNNLNTMNLVGIASHPTNPSQLAAGSQNNGVGLYNGNLAWQSKDFNGGTAGDVIWDFDRPNNLYHVSPIATSSATNFIMKSADGGNTWQPATNNLTNATQQNTAFFPPLIIDPSNSQRLFAATDQVWATDDGAGTWANQTKFSQSLNVDIPPTPLTGAQPPIPIDAIAVGRATFNILYVSQGGNLLRIVLNPIPQQPTVDSWVNVTPFDDANNNGVLDGGETVAGRLIKIIADPANNGVLYAIEGGFSTQHVWRSTSFGNAGSWSIIDGVGAEALPNLPTWTIALDSRSSTDASDDILYIGNDDGVWAINNPGLATPSWYRVGDFNIPVAQVRDLDLNTTTGWLTAATHGRGAWQTRIRGDIKGQVFDDTNGDGVKQAGEPGRAGVTVRLLDGNPASPTFGAEIATTVTDAQGNYEFSSVRSGDYQVVIVTPNGAVQTTANPDAFLSFTEQSIASPSFNGTPPPGYIVEPRLNFGTYTFSTISGTKFEDVDRDGVQDTDELGLAGFTIFIDRNNNGTLDAGEQFLDLNNNGTQEAGEPNTAVITDSNGNYTLTGIRPPVVMGAPGPIAWPLRIREVQQPGWTQTTPNLDVQPPSGTGITNGDVGNFRPGTIRGQVFFDLNGNGLKELNEPPQSNWQIYIDENTNGKFDFTDLNNNKAYDIGEPSEPTTFTDANGFFVFQSLPGGTYRVRQVVQSGWVQTTPNPNDIFLTGSNSVTGLLFGNFQSFNPWFEMGPRPIIDGQAPGRAPATGRFDSIAVDPTNSNLIYAASSVGGLWRSTDGGNTWSVRSDTLPDSSISNVLTFHRAGGNTVYATSDRLGLLYKSTDGATSFSIVGRGQFGFGSIDQLAAVPNAATPNDPNTDILFATVTGSGVFRSTNGGVTWTNISTGFPYDPTFTFYSDLDIDPTNPNVVYVSTGNPNGADNTVGEAPNGVYRLGNALTAGPTEVGLWTLQIGGSAFFPGVSPGTVRLSISPNAPSVLFASVAERNAPTTGLSRLLGIFRSVDAGVNWTGLYNPQVVPTGNVPNFMGGNGNYNNTFIVSPQSGPDPFSQILYAAGYGDSAFNVIVSTDSGNTWQDISVGANGIGPYVDSHGATFDSTGRLLLATEGGVYRLNSRTPVAWQSLNGAAPGLGALNTYTVPVGGYAPHPLDPYRGFANGGNDHTAALYNGKLPAGYGWTTLDSPNNPAFHTGFSNGPGREGSGEVFYNYNDPNTLYRVTTSAAGNDPSWIRRSNDGGLTWVPSSNAVPGVYTTGPALYKALIDPSNSQRIWAGTTQVAVSNDAGVTWSTTLQTSPTSSTPIPDFPDQTDPRFQVTAMGIGRTTGTLIYAGVSTGALFAIVLPDAAPPAQPAASDDWQDLGIPDGSVATQIIVDPNNSLNIYVITTSGRVFNWSSGVWTLLTDTNNGVPPSSPGANVIALDPRGITDPTDDVLYLGTNFGVFRLNNPSGNLNPGPYFWSVVGTGLPNTTITDLDVNTTTGIMTAGTFGRGVWQIQIRALIAGEKYEDLNGNGTRDAGEPGLEGVIIQVVDSTNNAVIATTTTDVDGFYEFRSLRTGDYFVREVVPVGFLQTSANPGLIHLDETDSAVNAYFGPTPMPASVEIVPNLAFGNFKFATISGVKFEDRNGDGIKQAGEPGLAGFTIFIDANNNGVLDGGETSTVTDSGGLYSFTNLGPGSYTIREIQQIGFIQTSTNPVAVVPTSGQNVTSAVVPGLDFGNIRIGRIAGNIFDDTNGNGAREVGEPPLGGFTVQLVDVSSNSIVRTLTSDPDGTYVFRSLPAGTYRIVEVPPASWVQTFPANNGTYTVTIAATDQVSGRDFGNFKLFSVSGIKFEDVNGDGVQNVGEVGVAGFVFNLTNTSTGAFTSSVSGAGGLFTFTNLGPGNYTLTEAPRAGWVTTTSNPLTFTGLSGVNRNSLNFGNFRQIQVSGTVYNDVNANGNRDAGEAGVQGFTVVLDRNNDGVVEASTLTDASGNYSFANLGPGNYVVRQLPRKGWELINPATGVHSFTAQSSVNLTGRDFGNRNRQIYVAGRDAGSSPQVSVRSLSTGTELFNFMAYDPRFAGGVRTASGYVQGTVYPNIITAAGAGGGPHVRVYNSITGDEVWGFYAYAANFSGGVFVASGDVDGDGFDDIITGAGGGGGPHVKVFSGKTRGEIHSFFAYSAGFAGGVRVASGDVDGDGFSDIITAAGPGGGPHVRVFNGKTLQVIREFFAYDPRFAGGVFVSAGDFNGDGKADIVTGAGPGGGPDTRIFNATNLALIGQIFPYPADFRGGVRVRAMDIDFDGRADLITGPGPGTQPTVKTFKFNNPGFTARLSQNVFDPTFLGGVFVG